MNEIIDLLENLMRQAAEMADELSEEEMIQVLNIFKQAIELIQAQQTSEAQGIQPQIPEIPGGPFPSSNVNGFYYDPDTQELKVQFHGPYPKAAGDIYSYKNVPKFIYDIFSKGAIGPKTSGKNRYHAWTRGVTPSLGGALNALLKSGGFEYSKIS